MPIVCLFNLLIMIFNESVLIIFNIFIMRIDFHKSLKIG